MRRGGKGERQKLRVGGEGREEQMRREGKGERQKLRVV
jgi:hypothetical protein